MIGSGPPPAGSRPRSSSSCPAAIRCCAAAFSASSSASSCADPRCSISRDPRREDHTTCTAVAPEVVFTVRTYGTRPLYGPRLVRKFSFREPKTRRSARRVPHEPAIVSQLRSGRRRGLYALKDLGRQDGPGGGAVWRGEIAEELVRLFWLTKGNRFNTSPASGGRSLNS